MCCWLDARTRQPQLESDQSAAVYLLIQPDRNEQFFHRQLVARWS
jgi:hypothetical protein